MGNIERSREHNAAVAKLRDEWDNDHTASPGTYSRWLEARVVTLAQQHAGAVDLLHEVAVSGVEHEDPRIGYVAVQIDRETWDALATYRGQSGAAPREETT